MLNGIRIYTNDDVWRKILTDLGANSMSDSNLADINVDSLDIPDAVSPLELKSIILNSLDIKQQNIIRQVFGKHVVLPALQMQIVVLLMQTGGMSAADLKSTLAPDIATHTIDTAIYHLRKTYGRDFIKNENGKYFLG